MATREPRSDDHAKTTPATFRVGGDGRLLVMYDRDNEHAWIESDAWADLFSTT